MKEKITIEYLEQRPFTPLHLIPTDVLREWLRFNQDFYKTNGYYLPATPEEFDEFVQQEYRAKIVDMQETLSAMQKSAERTWGRYSPARQLSLFG